MKCITSPDDYKALSTIVKQDSCMGFYCNSEEKINHCIFYHCLCHKVDYKDSLRHSIVAKAKQLLQQYKIKKILK